MRFSVVCKAKAISQLADIWTDAGDQAAVSRAANEIETQLRTAPENFGESRSGRDRIAIVPPLSVIFEVRPADRVVAILTFKRVQRRE